MSVAEVAARFVEAKAADGPLDERWGDDWWVWEAVIHGVHSFDTDAEGPLDPALWSALIVEAARLAALVPEDRRDTVYFSLGDGSIDMLAAVDPTARHRFHALRATRPGVDGIFRVMQEEAEAMGHTGSSPWDDDYPLRHPLPDSDEAPG